MRSKSIISVILMTLASCSYKPADFDACSAFNTKFGNLTAGTSFDILSFKRTDGQSFELNGIKGYRFFYEALVSFPDGFRSECINQRSDVEHYMINVSCAAAFGGPSGGNPIGPHPKGDLIVYVGTVEFQQTEKRWIAGGTTLAQQSRANRLALLARPDDAKVGCQE